MSQVRGAPSPWERKYFCVLSKSNKKRVVVKLWSCTRRTIKDWADAPERKCLALFVLVEYTTEVTEGAHRLSCNFEFICSSPSLYAYAISYDELLVGRIFVRPR